jgi:hypothetical protein
MSKQKSDLKKRNNKERKTARRDAKRGKKPTRGTNNYGGNLTDR